MPTIGIHATDKKIRKSFPMKEIRHTQTQLITTTPAFVTMLASWRIPAGLLTTPI
jgi:hypothetical protein